MLNEPSWYTSLSVLLGAEWSEVPSYLKGGSCNEPSVPAVLGALIVVTNTVPYN